MAQSKEVFLSYGHEPEVDKFVTRLKSDLEEEGISVWRDKDDIKAGSNWPNMIGVGVYDCRALLCVLTNKYVSSSDNCKRELDYALAQRKMVFPVLYETVDWKKNENAKGVSFVLGNIQRADFRPDKVDYQEALKNLVTAMKERGLGQAGTPERGVGETPRGDHGETPGKGPGQVGMPGAVQAGMQGGGQGGGSQQSNGASDANLSENVYERLGYLMLFRQHVSRKAAGKGRRVLEGVKLDLETIDTLIVNNPDDMESTVQAGLIKWSGGQGRPPTWKVLCDAMKEARMDDWGIDSLKQALKKPPLAPTGELARTPQAMQNVNAHKDYVMLFRQYVSRNAASKGRAVLEGVGLKASSIQASFNPKNVEEEAVQDGLRKWREGHEGFQPPTWGVLIEAIEYAQIDQQAIKDLKSKLDLPLLKFLP